MAILTIGPGMTEDFSWQDIFQPGWWPDSTLAIASDTTLVFESYNAHNDQDFIVVIEGTGFDYGDFPGYGDADAPNAGTVTKVTVYYDDEEDQQYDGDAVALAFTGLNVRLDKLFYQLFDYSTPDADHGSDGWRAVSLLLGGNDKVQLAPSVTDRVRITVGENRGNDTFLGNGGDNYFEGNEGKDVYDGRGGHNDGVDYIWRTLDNGVTRGIVLNVTSRTGNGTIKDPWGFTDTVKGIEEFGGTLNKDVMRGANQADDGPKSYTEWFRPYDGRDTIDGRGGFDALTYQDDHQYPGGLHGIVATLADKGFGKIKDSFGSFDKVMNIEFLMSTNFADILTGNKFDNWFQSLGGNDLIDGKGGFDTLEFWKNKDYIEDGITGGDGRVIAVLADGNGDGTVTDGLGGTDTVRHIENISGSFYDDDLTGNSGSNSLNGQDGADVLNGRLGNDTLYGGRSDEDNGVTDGKSDTFVFDTALGPNNVDNVREFEVGTDVLLLDPLIFTAFTGPEAYLDPGAFLSAAGATQSNAAGVYIVYNTTNGNLYYDANAEVAGGSVLFARILGMNGTPVALQASDIYIGD